MLLVDEEVRKMLDKGAIQLVPENRHPSLWLLRIFLVPKKTGDLHLIINLRPLNVLLSYEHFKMEGLFMLRELL